MSRQTVLFSGGGSAGHLAPGFAIAEALAARGIRPLFSTPGEPTEGAWFHGREAPSHVPAARLPRGPGGLLRFLSRTWRGVRGGRSLLRREGVGVVVGLGGWPCVPLLLAARRSKVPYVLVCPDAVPGQVVRRFAKRAARIYLAHDEARQGLPTGVPVRVDGPWLRQEILAGASELGRFGLTGDLPVLLVLGGSLGAQGLFERWLASLEALHKESPAIGAGFQVIHALGRTQDPEPVRARYAALGVRAYVTSYLEAMGSAYRSADLVLARAGANTCAELVATGAPALLVPYPHHKDRQQFRNAAPLVAAGGALLLEEASITATRVADQLVPLLHDSARRAKMRAQLAALRRGGAVETAADLANLLSAVG